MTPAARISQEINRILKENPNADFGDSKKLKTALAEIDALDRQFEEKGGIYFAPGSNAFETAERFTQIHIEQYRETGRPSLPALAVHHAEKIGIEKDSPEYKAMLMVAVRAEMKVAVMPDYHNQCHFTDVAAMTATLLEKNNEMVKNHEAGATPLTKMEQALTFIAAIGHDLDHEGRGNPKDNPLLNEEKSFQLMEPLLREAGLKGADVDKIHTILMTTSPNGPHAVLKAVAHAQREGKSVDYSKIEGAEKFPDLKVLVQDKKLTQMAAIVSDSDLYASSGAGEKSGNVMSRALSKETGENLTTADSTKFFFDRIVGESYASHAGNAVAGEAYQARRAEVGRKLAAAPKPPRP